MIHLFCEKSYIVDGMYNFFAGLITGMKKKMLTREAVNRGQSCNTSKTPLSIGVYWKMFQIFILYNKPEHIFAHYFLTLCFSLMDWSDNSVVLHLNHIECSYDRIIIYFPSQREIRKG